MACIHGPSFAILINSTPSIFFWYTIEIHQYYPPSPYLFICCADMLSQALQAAASGSGFDPYAPVLGVQPIYHLLFIDYCLLMGWASLWNAVAFSRILEALWTEG